MSAVTLIEAWAPASGALIDSPNGPRAHPAAVEARQQRITLARLFAALRRPTDVQHDDSRPQRRIGVRGAVPARVVRRRDPSRRVAIRAAHLLPGPVAAAGRGPHRPAGRALLRAAPVAAGRFEGAANAGALGATAWSCCPDRVGPEIMSPMLASSGTVAGLFSLLGGACGLPRQFPG